MTVSFSLQRLCGVISLISLALCAIPPVERAALMDIYNDCDGVNWKYRPSTEGDPCDDAWFGVACDPTNSTILKLFPNSRWSGNRLIGTLPSSISNLSHLTQLYTSNDRTPSHLEGPIPESLGQMTTLKCLYLAHNRLNGTIPASFSNLVNMQGLFLRLNRLKGHIPDLSPMTDLRHIIIDENRLEGEINFLDSMPNLEKMIIRLNKFSGILPQSACKLDKCVADLNQWSCPLPTNTSTGHHCCHTVRCSSTDHQEHGPLPKTLEGQEIDTPRRCLQLEKPYVCHTQ